jgi:hypothetical protein
MSAVPNIFVGHAGDAGCVETFIKKKGHTSRRLKWSGLKRCLADKG